ncbi:hypothetical protein AVEN_178132-1 [Araneus ventricosus]|uniref:Uncharacterized protein n=1 Tax=Araneus ventricosus TaxID=182803 RepID=A0A4Y2GB00_ARAVE|nr:hypothetical protein AVEN_178132-1 [Araneus ventricosus]
MHSLTIKPLLRRGGIASTSRPEYPGSEPDSTKDPPYMWTWCIRHASGVEGQRPSAGVVRKFGGGASADVVLVI